MLTLLRAPQHDGFLHSVGDFPGSHATDERYDRPRLLPGLALDLVREVEQARRPPPAQE